MTMMVSRRALLGGFALGGAGLMLPGAALAWKADGGAAYPATAAFIEGFVDRRELAGTLAAIGKGQGALDVFGAGTQAMDSARAVDGDTIWRLYSMTKPVTGIAAMILTNAMVFRYRVWQIVHRRLYQEKAPLGEWLRHEFS